MEGSARREAGNQEWTAAREIGVAGPSALPRNMRLSNKIAAPPANNMGNCTSAQVNPITKMIHWMDTLLPRAPVTTAITA